MQVVAKSIDEIKPYENNPRNNDDAVDATANSIKQFGWQQPIVVDNDGVIVAGHTRYKAAKKLGLKHVPVVQAVHDDGTPLTDEEINAYRLADNKTGELASWDFDMLNEEIDNIKDIDMSQFGFDDIEEPDLPDNFFEEDDSGNDSTDDSEDKLILDWGTNSAEITTEEQQLLDKKLNDFDNQEGNKSFLQFLMEQ